MSDNVTYADDPTETVLSESALNSKWLCDYVINTATGCRHGCRFCYVPSTPAIRTRPDMLEEQADVEDPQKEWGTYVLHRDPDETEEKLRSTLENKRKWKHTEGGRGIVALSFSTDCYQDQVTAEVTARCVEVLLEYDKPVRILTRNPTFAAQTHLSLYTEGAEKGLVTFGTSIPSLNFDRVAAIEPNAPPPKKRLSGLKEISEAGIPVYVSMSPTYPTATEPTLRSMLRLFNETLPTLDVVFHEALNPRGANFEMTVEAARADGCEHLADQLEVIRDRERWRNYAVHQLGTVADAAAEWDIPIKLWPGQMLVDECEGTGDYGFVKGAYDRPSPEDFPTGDPDV